MIDYCWICGTHMENTEVPVSYFNFSGIKNHSFDKIPAKICPKCGEIVYSAVVFKQLLEENK